MIWGMTLHPGEEYNKEVDREEHLTLATLDCRLKITKDVCHPLAHLVVRVNNSEHVLCFLEKGITHQQSLDFIFQKGDKLVFTVEGNAVIHITGYSMRDSIYENTHHGDNNGIRILKTVSLAGVQGDQNSTLFFEEQLKTNDENCSSHGGGHHEGHSQQPSVKLERNEGFAPSHITAEGTVEWEDNGVATSTLQISAGDFNHVQREDGTEIDLSPQNLHENLGVVSRDHASPTEVHTDCGRVEIEHDIAEDNVNGNQIDSSCVLQESNLRGKSRPSERQTAYQPSFEDGVTEYSKQNKDYELLYQDGQPKDIDVPVLRETSEEVKFYTDKFAESNSHSPKSNVEEYLESSSLHDSSVHVTNSFENEEKDITDLEPEEQSVDPTSETCLNTAEHESNQELAVSEEDDNGTDEFQNSCHTFVGSTKKSVGKGPSMGESPCLSPRCDTGKEQCTFTLKADREVKSKKGSFKSPRVNTSNHRQGRNKETESKTAESNKKGSKKSSTTMWNELFLCHFCGKMFTKIKRCQKHEKNHSKNGSFECQFCGKVFAQKSQMIVHERKHQNVKESVKSSSSTAITVKKHNLKHEKTYNIGETFECRVRSKIFKSKHGLLRHQVIRNVVRRFRCRYCSKRFTARFHVVNHERIHTGERPFKCQFCPKAFAQKSNCTQHEKRHTREKPCKSRFSETRYISKSHVENDEKRHQSGESNFSCHFCLDTFTTKSQLTQHEKSHKSTGKKERKCAYCDKSFLLNTARTLHEKNHHSELTFRCRFCVKGFISKEKVTQHENSHTAEKKFKCTQCSQRFRTKNEKTVHERIHTNERPYKCSFCAKRFIQKNHVDSHERIHTNQKPFKCSFCGKGFRQKSSLNYHERTHTKGKGH